MKQIVFNGKFYAGSLNGVHRVADRLITEIDRLAMTLPVNERPRMKVIVPSRASWRPDVSAIEIVEEEGKCGQVWEQFILPRRAAGGVLVNLCNLAPILHRDKLMLIHDAQFLLPDSSYPLRQRIGYRLLVPWMSRTSKRVLTVSHYSRQTLSTHNVSPLTSTGVLYNGVDHILDVASVAPDPGQLPPGRFVVMFGSPKGYKNNKVVFDAFRDNRLAGFKLVVVGAERESLEREGLQPPMNAAFVGKIGDEALKGLYESALCILFPSRTEGFGLPPAEAMVCGCPAVVSPGGAIPEVCRDAATYADVDEPETWVDAIVKLDRDPALRASKIELGRELMGRFTWAAAGERLMQEITHLAGGLHQPSRGYQEKRPDSSARLDLAGQNIGAP